MFELANKRRDREAAIEDLRMLEVINAAFAGGASFERVRGERLRVLEEKKPATEANNLKDHLDRLRSAGVAFVDG